MPAGRPRKPPGRRARGKRTKTFELIEGGKAGVVPPASEHWSKQTRERWAAYHRSDAAQVMVWATDEAALRRLFDAYDDFDHYRSVLRKAPLVKGSTGQPAVSPVAKLVAAIKNEMERGEDRFGLTPKSRLQLGIEDGASGPTIDEINRALQMDLLEDDEDPRETG